MPADSFCKLCLDVWPSSYLFCTFLLCHSPAALSRSSSLHCLWGFQFRLAFLWQTNPSSVYVQPTSIPAPCYFEETVCVFF
jgi:hypothetical protein